MSDSLSKICIAKRAHISARKNAKTESELHEEIELAQPPRGFEKALRKKDAENKIGLIAEIKKASPSKGVIRADFDPELLAKSYYEGGATCISVLTDEPYFQGKDEYLKLVHKTVPLPILRKDFMIDPYQVLESRALGADCILLIMAALNDDEAEIIENTAFDLGMDVLIEVHEEIEIERALKRKSKMIGINNRNLKTLDIDLSITENLRKKIPKNYLIISESGFFQPGDIERIRSQNVNCFLIGESLMRAGDVEHAVKSLIGL